MQVTGRQSASPRPFSAGHVALAAHRTAGKPQLQLSQPLSTQEQAQHGQCGTAMQPLVGPVSRPQPRASTHWQQHSAAQQPAGHGTTSGPAQATMQPIAATTLQPLAPAIPGSLCKTALWVFTSRNPADTPHQLILHVASRHLALYLTADTSVSRDCTSPSASAVDAQMAGLDAHPELSLEVVIRQLQQEKDDLQRQ